MCVSVCVSSARTLYYIIYLFTLHYHGILQLALYIYNNRGTCIFNLLTKMSSCIRSFASPDTIDAGAILLQQGNKK